MKTFEIFETFSTLLARIVGPGLMVNPRRRVHKTLIPKPFRFNSFLPKFQRSFLRIIIDTIQTRLTYYVLFRILFWTSRNWI